MLNELSASLRKEEQMRYQEMLYDKKKREEDVRFIKM